MNSGYDLVIFDCDGVLVDTEAIDDLIVSSLLKEIGLDIEPHEVATKSIGLSDTDMWKQYEKEFGRPLPADMISRHTARVIEAFQKDLKPMPGVKAVVQMLSESAVPICIASNGSIEKMNVTLDITGLIPYFDGNIFSADQVDKGKPDPELFLLAAKTMGFEPGQCVVIEDSRPGVVGALAAGMTVLGYCPNGDTWNLGDLGVTTLSNMSVLPQLIGLN